MDAYESEFPADLHEVVHDAQIERRRDESVGVMVTIRSRPFRLTRHESEYEPAHWRLEHGGSYRRATLGEDYLYELGLAWIPCWTGNRAGDIGCGSLLGSISEPPRVKPVVRSPQRTLERGGRLHALGLPVCSGARDLRLLPMPVPEAR